MRKAAWGALVLALVFLGTASGFAESRKVGLSKGQTVYVPVYSHVYHGIKSRPFGLAVTLSIRNTDLGKPMTVDSVVYYDSSGKKVRTFLEKPETLGPLGSIRFIVEEKDMSGGSGASFIVRWRSEHSVTSPVVQTVMIGTANSQGISFVCSGQAVEELAGD